MQLTVKTKKMLRMIPLTLLLMAAGCTSLTSRTPTWPTNLNVTELSDGSVCFTKDSAVRLAEFKADLEAL